MSIELVFRLILLVVLVSVLSISAYFRRRARACGEVIPRKDEGIVALALRMVLALPLVVSLLGYVIDPQLLAWSEVAVSVWLRVLFAGVSLLCIPAVWWVFRTIGRNISETVLTKRDHQLVMEGPYRWVRHPLYATALLMLGSFSILAANWFIFAYSILALATFRFIVIPAEEAKLIEAFGEDYRKYQEQAGALTPRLFHTYPN